MARLSSFKVETRGRCRRHGLPGAAPFPRKDRLQQSAIREGYGGFADDQVIQDPDIDKSQRFFQAVSDVDVVAGRFGDTARMVVGEDHGSGVMGESVFNHLAGVNSGPVYGAPEQLGVSDCTVPVIEPEDGEDFVVLPGNKDLEMFGGGLGGWLRFPRAGSAR